MVKYVCRVCKKEIKHGRKFLHVVREFVFPNNIVKMIGEKIMKKLIIKDGKLVKQEELPNEQVIEQTKTKLFSRSQVNPQPIPTVEPEKEVLEEELEEEQYQHEKDIESYRRIKAMMEKEAALAARDNLLLKKEFVRHKIEEEQEERQAAEDYAELHPNIEEVPKHMIFKFILTGNSVLNFNVKQDEADELYNHIAKSMETDKTIKIENKIIMVSSILFFEFVTLAGEYNG